jgi:hypothetical protein
MTQRFALVLCLGTAIVARAQTLEPVDQAAPTGQAQASDVADEFCSLEALLDELPASFGAWRRFDAPNPGSVLAARLALFSFRTGTDPRSAREWAELQARAGHALDLAVDKGRKITGHIADAAAQMDRYVLLHILGRDAEADPLLDGISLHDEDDCLWCTPEARVIWSQRQSERAEAGGDAATALSLLHDAVLDMSDGLPGADLLLLRYGLLLLRTGHEDVGLIVLQNLVRTRPESVGAAGARGELSRRGALRGIDGARMTVGGGLVLVPRGEATVPAEWELAAIWRTDERTSMRWIAARLPSPDGSDPRTVAFEAIAAAAVQPWLEATFAAGFGSVDALTIAQGLPGGAEPYVERCLGQLDSRDRQPVALMLRADEALRWMHGGGPELVVPLGRCDGGALCREWRKWRKDTGRHVLVAR